MSDKVTPLYRVIFDAEFWKSVGFRTKRSSDEVEKGERKYLSEHIEDLYDIISSKREAVAVYIREYYGEKIRGYNEDDKTVSLSIQEDRMSRAYSKAKYEALRDFAVDQISWVRSIDVPVSIDKDVIREKIQEEAQKRGKSTSENGADALNAENVTEDIDTDMCEIGDDIDSGIVNSIDHWLKVKEICDKFPDEMSSKEISEYIRANALI